MKVCIVQPGKSGISETFLDAQAKGLNAEVKVLYKASTGGQLCINGRPVLSSSLLGRLRRKVGRAVRRRSWEWEHTAGYLQAFRDSDVVLAQYGVTGVRVMEACRLAGKPLIVHFHGYDASQFEVIQRYGVAYQQMFREAAAVVVVSRAMKAAVLKLGCPPSKVVVNIYGVAQDKSTVTNAGKNPPVLLSVGRFVDKKAPQLTLVAFSYALENFPKAKLRMIGGGRLLDPCKDLAEALGIAHAVEFLGPQPHSVVLRAMEGARAFAQHSIVSCSGDSEGTPVAVLEAGAMGLPVIATKHAGIPDVAVHGQTAFLVEEKDVRGMANAMVSLLDDPQLAGRLGSNAAAHIGARFTVEQSTDRLTRILVAVATGQPLESIQHELDALLDACVEPVEASTW